MRVVLTSGIKFSSPSWAGSSVHQAKHQLLPMLFLSIINGVIKGKTRWGGEEAFLVLCWALNIYPLLQTLQSNAVIIWFYPSTTVITIFSILVRVPHFLTHSHKALSHPAGRDKKVSVACCWIDFLSDLDTGPMLPDPGWYILERKQLHRNPTAAHSQLQ